MTISRRRLLRASTVLPVVCSRSIAAHASRIATPVPRPSGNAQMDEFPWRIGCLSEPSTFNPLLAGNAVATSITRRIFESILGRSPDASRPWLTELMDPNDIQTFGLTIDPTARWQDGAPVIEDDIVMSLEAAQYHEWFSDEWEVQELGGGFLRIGLAGEPNAYFVEDVLRRVGVLPHHIWGDIGYQGWRDAAEGNGSDPSRVIGSSRYRFNTWERGDHLSVIRNDAYWGGHVTPYREVQWRFYPDLQSLIAARCAEQVDEVIDIPPGNASDLDCPNGRSASILSYDTLRSTMVFFNLSRDSPLLDPAVRRALSLSVDRVGIAETLFGSRVAIVQGTQSPLSAAFSAEVDWQVPQFDETLAFAELANAGIDPSSIQMQLSLLVAPGVDSRIASALQDAWGTIGGEILIEENAHFDRFRAGDFDAWLGTFSWWPSGNQASVFGTDGRYNVTGFSNPDYDELTAQAKQEPDPAARVELLRRADEIVLAEAPAIFLWYDQQLALLDPRHEGLVPTGLDPYAYLD